MDKSFEKIPSRRLNIDSIINLLSYGRTGRTLTVAKILGKALSMVAFAVHLISLRNLVIFQATKLLVLNSLN